MPGKHGGAAPRGKDAEHAPYVTVARGLSGYFAVMMWWNDLGEHGLPGFWEPYDTGIGRYPEPTEAEAAAMQWASEEGLRYLAPGRPL